MTDNEADTGSHPARYSTVAMPLSQHDVVTIAYDDWDDIWQPSRTVSRINPGRPDNNDPL